MFTIWNKRLLSVKSPSLISLPLMRPEISHSINYEETDTSEGLWDRFIRLGRRKMTNMSFSKYFQGP